MVALSFCMCLTLKVASNYGEHTFCVRRFELVRFRGALRAFALLFFLASTYSLAQGDRPKQPGFDVKQHYTKYGYRVPMRDGVRLFTAVYVPKSASETNRYPFLVTRTPYSVRPYGPDQYPARLAPRELMEAGYIFVLQDVRGRYMSEGTWVEMRPHIDNKESKQDVDESTDMYDTVEFLLKNIGFNNGNVGIWGVSYPGFYTSASIIDSHPAIKAASPQAPMTDLYMNDDAYHGGAFMLAGNFLFYNFFKPQQNPVLPPKSFPEFDFGTQDGYELLLKLGSLANIEKEHFRGSNPFWTDQLRHSTYDDYWKARNLAPHMRNIKAAVLTVGGLFDAEDLQGPFSTYRSIEEKNPGIVNSLVLGPWVHGGWQYREGASLGAVNFNSSTGEFYRKNIILPFFEHYLKGKGEAKLPEAYVFETGTNVWKQFESWPPRQATTATLYLQANGKLGFTASTTTSAYDEYVSDPNRPVPFVGYTTIDMPQEYMVADQRFASRRPDVLVYQTDPLQEDVTIVGPVKPHLFVSTTGTDSDFVVKLVDVYPSDLPEPSDDDADRSAPDVKAPQEPIAGYQQLVRGQPLRAKFRKSFERPEALTPGKVEELNFSMPDVAHTFRRGHRIMVQVQSTWFPLIDRNPQVFTDIPNAKPEDFQKATQRVYHSPQQPSGLEVLVLKK